MPFTVPTRCSTFPERFAVFSFVTCVLHARAEGQIAPKSPSCGSEMSQEKGGEISAKGTCVRCLLLLFFSRGTATTITSCIYPPPQSNLAAKTQQQRAESRPGACTRPKHHKLTMSNFAQSSDSSQEMASAFQKRGGEAGESLLTVNHCLRSCGIVGTGR